MIFGELVRFVNEVYAPTSTFKLLEMFFDIRDSPVRKPRPSSFYEMISRKNLQGRQGFRVVSRYCSFPCDG